MAHLYMVKTERQATALKRRDRFLREHPELREFQRKIDARLNGAGSDHNRLVLIHELMMDSLGNLSRELRSVVAVQR
ncbi:MAG TPA: hypothetical protein VMC85_14010 [Desulfomonilaceae bacterium]|nr:hypothetical protein [Desulfomonilaceae bacterium]